MKNQACAIYCFLLMCGFAPPAYAADDDTMSPLVAAIAAGNWIRYHEVETEHGLAWPMVPDESNDIVRNLYSGTPGVILFFLELGKATGDQSWLDDAKRGADDLMASLPDDLSEADPSLWSGIAGQAFTLHRVHLATGEAKYMTGAEKGLDLIKNSAIEDEQSTGVHWSDVTDIIGGTAGIGLFLIYAANEMDDPEALKIAAKAGDDLITRARLVELDGGQTGMKWAMTEAFPRLMPNFSHGTAGICYFLTGVHIALQSDKSVQNYDGRFLPPVRKGLNYLGYVADRSDDGFRIFHHEPDGEDLMYYGWCHGPVGTARLFTLLHEHVVDEAIFGAEACAQSLLVSGIPERRLEGFWNNVGPCCGTAGVASFMLEFWRSRPKQEYLSFLRRLQSDIMQRATKVELSDGSVGLKWIQAEHRVRPEFLQAQTGYMQGAAGIGLWLLRLDAFEKGRAFDLRFPDEPWE